MNPTGKMNQTGNVRRLIPVVAITVLLASCTPPGQDKAKPTGNDLTTPPAKSTVLNVQVVKATSGTLTVRRSASAIITAQKDSQVAADTGGTVKQLLVQEGEAVAAGDVVVQLDDIQQRQALDNARLQLQQAQINFQQMQNSTTNANASLSSAVTSAQATLAQAQQNAQSAESLYGLGGISLADLQAARAALAQAQSGLAASRNTLEQNGRSAQGSVPLQQVALETAQTGVRQAEENLARTAVKAPFAGTVATISAKVGEFAAQGSAVFRLVDPGSISAKFNIPSSDAFALTDGSKLNLGYGGVNYVAVVQGSPGIAGSDRLVPITARIQGGSKLPVGAAAQVRYRATLGSGVLIPSSAVQVDGGENAVYVATDGKAERRVVTVIAESGGKLAVGELSPGALVINPLPASLQDGAAVAVATGAAKTDAAAASSPAPDPASATPATATPAPAEPKNLDPVGSDLESAP
ncbi:efflux RND transporter periplasmic adaptor subunit [Deinococcus arenicola]|uniref:HlyD family efflux transporter periplasmic adaptor subunit n=1 Tax=Deinococcus arenicola TaxID=2994950 RepID=A0ABU4DUE0_9DEIO|nr:HlyD family efflux transporter periplasmic adaptor subunit [Deinococcus sp. ZS9-10]MDV6375592.1 HlyD family efflux transporter periplasmic adaptor subunit [Deinococcus sp. ZS9-10]